MFEVSGDFRCLAKRFETPVELYAEPLGMVDGVNANQRTRDS